MSAERNSQIGKPQSRVDGRLKVTGAARYAAEYDTADLLHAYVVPSTIAAGTILSIDIEAALKSPGVIDILTHENKQDVSWWDRDWTDTTASPGHPFRPLHSERILFDGQPVALVIADSFEAARDAASLVDVIYDAEAHVTDLRAAEVDRYEPPKKRANIPPPPKPKGDASHALATATHRVNNRYAIAPEFHNPMEMLATTVVYGEGDLLTIYDKTQGSQNVQSFVSKVFDLKPDQVHVINAYVGGAFGLGLRPKHNVFLAVLASLKLKRSVRLEVSRREMFYQVYRPASFQNVGLGSDAEGRLTAIMHDAVCTTSLFEDYQENVVNWSTLAYHADNTTLGYGLAQVNTNTPGDMRGPGAASGNFAIESAMDELAAVSGIDPIALRLANYTTRDEDNDKELTSKSLRACYSQGAERFGWDKRSAAPRSMQEDHELIGYGMASAVWEANVQPTEARVVLRPNGLLEVETASSDIGTGTYTILSQIAADAFGIEVDKVTTRIGDSRLPTTPVEGGSWGAASSGMAVFLAAQAVQKKLLKLAGKHGLAGFKNSELDDVIFADGKMTLKSDANQSATIFDLMDAAGLDEIAEQGKAAPDPKQAQKYVSYTHAAVFAEVRVDEQLGVVRVKRIVNAVAAGRILNPKTARSQVLGGVVMGLGMALHEEGLFDHGTGRIMNHNLAEYHVPAHADIEDIEVLFVDEKDELVNQLGIKGLGEIGIVGTAAAIANAIYHATGKRIRELPITIDKILA